MSMAMGKALPPAASISSAAVKMVPGSLGCGSVVLPVTTTLAPSRAARSAIARPMPRLVPVMNRVLPARVGMGALYRDFFSTDKRRSSRIVRRILLLHAFVVMAVILSMILTFSVPLCLCGESHLAILSPTRRVLYWRRTAEVFVRILSFVLLYAALGWAQASPHTAANSSPAASPD